MPLYRVRPGFRHGARDQYKAGDLVEHTETEAAGFLDKLELVQKVPAPKGVQAFDVTDATVAGTVQAVAGGLISAADALAAERAGKRRKTLIEALEALPDGANSN